jgi:hypothetical protein
MDRHRFQTRLFDEKGQAYSDAIRANPVQKKTKLGDLNQRHPATSMTDQLPACTAYQPGFCVSVFCPFDLLNSI